MGTRRFAAEILDELADFHEIAAVYTRPDAVRGRGKALVPSPVKEVAERRGFPVRTPRTLRDAAVLSELAAFAPDVICVAAYGAILPKEVLDLPPFGCLNVHGSLLPRWRGAAPIERAILAGDEEIGVCIMAMEEGLDTGDYCVCRSLPAGSRTAAELTEELAALGASALLTAIIQSSSASVGILQALSSTGQITFGMAFPIIMGQNIGTTITGQLIALDASKIAPLVAIFGVVLVTFLKGKKVNAFGEIFAGLGILFIGMDMMKDAMVPLQQSEAFIHAMTTISNPVLAILLGAGFTALIQSSSASVGILQALAVSGLIPLSSAIYIIFGQNIGTCITSVLASLGANRNAKRATIIHLSFNIIGTIVFMAFAALVPFVSWMESVTSNPAAQIAKAL